MVTRLLVRFKGAVGDVVVLTAAIRDLKLSNPELQIKVDTSHPEVWWHNPHLSSFTEPDFILEPDYLPGIVASQQGVKKHFLCWFHDFFVEQLGVPCRLTAAKPDLHLVPDDFRHVNHWFHDRPCWLVFAGGKEDATVKIWDADRYQQVIDVLQEQGYFFVQSGATGGPHIQPKLQRVIREVGDKDLRKMFAEIKLAAGVLCPITSAMHIAAALDRKCVVVAGGREEPWWEAYRNDTGGFPSDTPVVVEHLYLNTIGKMPCCQHNGCWLSLRPQDGTGKVCTNMAPRPLVGYHLPACLDSITVSDVVSAVLSLQ